MTTQCVQKGSPAIEGIGHVAHHTDTLNKFVKTVEQGVAIAKTVASVAPGGEGVAAGLGLLGGQLKTTKSVINATNVLERGYEWGAEKARGKILSSWQKTANRVALTAAQVLETVLFIDKCSSSFFYQASLTVRGLPILEVVKNVFYIGSAVFGLWTSGKDLSKALSTIHSTQLKKHKWEELTIDAAALNEKYEAKLNDKGGSSERLKAEMNDLSEEIQEKKKLLDIAKGSDAKSLRSEIKQAKSRLEATEKNCLAAEKFESYLKAIRNNQAASIREHKIEKYDVRLANSRKKQEKSWLAIAVDIGKIFMISLGMTVVALSLVYPVLTGPTAVLVISSLSLVSNALGLTKNIYSEVAPKEQEEPVLAVAV